MNPLPGEETLDLLRAAVAALTRIATVLEAMTPAPRVNLNFGKGGTTVKVTVGELTPAPDPALLEGLTADNRAERLIQYIESQLPTGIWRRMRSAVFWYPKRAWTDGDLSAEDIRRAIARWFCTMTWNEILLLPNVGPKRVAILRESAARFGVFLKERK